MTPEEMSAEDLRRIQDVILEVLLSIDKVCRELGLRYYLIAGTMLGAVRHGGFVPWDDDADVGLPRPDYERLLKHAKEWLPPHLELVHSGINKDYPYDFARIQDRRTTYILRRSFNYVGGIPVDVFPLDGMTEEKGARRRHYRKYSRLVKTLYYCQSDPYKHGKGIRSLLCNLLRRFNDTSDLHRRIDALQREWDYETTTLTADHDNKPKRGILPREVYGTPTPIMFEGHELMGVEKPDEYLRCCYGDYMTPPTTPPPANFRYIDLEKPYSEF